MNLESMSDVIEGVVVKPLKSHGDDRGFFREIIRVNDPFFMTDNQNSESPFGQWSHSKMKKHTIKAWHYHHKQTDWWYICSGTARVGLIDNRPESKTYKKKLDFILGDESEDATIAAVKIPPGVLHGCRVFSEYAHLFYITSQVYDPNDEGRIPFNAQEIDFDWGDENNIIVSKNDTEYFEPKYKLKSD